MNKKLGIRYEDRFKMERRVAIIPADARKLIESAGLEFYVERSEKRIFSDDEFSSAGAKIVDDVSEIPVIFGVKEMPVDYFRKNHTYIFFSHTIKGQEYNMPALKKMIEKEVNLIDYEKVTDEEGRRLIFFGRYAGLAGMINSLWALGKRLAIKGITNPFEKINQSHTYDSLEDAKNVIGDVAKEIISGALSQLGKPLVVGFTGYGNVSQGAQEIIQLLPVEYVTPEQLKELALKGNWSGKKIYTVVFKEEHLVVPKDPAMDFELQDYYNNPSKYTSDFEQYIDKLTVLMNCMYWDDKFPRLITNDYLARHYTEDHSLLVVGDITCDPNGSIECTQHCTTIESPNYVFDPVTSQVHYGFKGDGLLIMAVDILPSELPKESSRGFSTALFSYVESIVKADYSRPFDELDLPGPIKRALILHNGKFTPDYSYMKKFTRK